MAEIFQPNNENEALQVIRNVNIFRGQVRELVERAVAGDVEAKERLDAMREHIVETQEAAANIFGRSMGRGL